MKNRKKIIFNIVFFLILFPPALAMWLLLFFVVIDNSDAIDGIDYGPQLSEKTVLSLFDNLSNLAITGHADFKDDKFCLKFCNFYIGALVVYPPSPPTIKHRQEQAVKGA